MVCSKPKMELNMIVAIGSDHAGFPLKETVIRAVHAAGHEVLDLGTHNLERVDFTDFD